MEFFVKSFEDLDINELYEILKLRVDVFVVEQNCPYPEIDGIDKEAFHIFAKEDGEMPATQGYIRKMARFIWEE